MTAPDRHQAEIQAHRQIWQDKPLLREIYRQFYGRILPLLDRETPGATVELGSGIGNLKAHLPGVICTDLFPNPWLDLVCDAYELPFASDTISNLILFDVFHHLAAPRAFLKEARRVLAPAGRLLLFEPYISGCSYPVYGLLHPEPVAWGRAIRPDQEPPRPRPYYAAQGNATRLFFHDSHRAWLAGWEVFHRQAFSAWSYLLSGGFSRPAFYPRAWLPWLEKLDARLSCWPRLFGARCLIGLRPALGGA